MNYGTGWKIENEALHVDAFAKLEQPMCAVSAGEIPETADPFGIIPVNDQGPRNSCTGNATDKVLEFDEWLQTGNVVNLSARFSYLAARIVDGSNQGPDAGASISGTALATQRMGTVLEQDFPYWKNGERFDPTIPDALLQRAKDHRVRSATRIASVAQMIDFIGSGQGGVVFGVVWTDTLANFSGGGILARDRGNAVGGHAICCIGYKTVGGVKYPRMWNSHSERWGDRGTALVDPDLFERWLQSQYGAWGLTGLTAFTKRKFRTAKGVFTS